jgi:hypothetical protein
VIGNYTFNRWLTVGNNLYNVLKWPDGSISVRLGRGDGTFPTVSDLYFDANADQFAVGDYDRDGKLDLMVTQLAGEDAAVAFLRGDGAGGFAAPVNSNTVALIMGQGDFLGDGHLDLLANVSQPGKGLIGLLSTSGGAAAPLSSYPLALDVSNDNLAVGDFNKDGKLDFVINVHAGTFLFSNQGNGAFTQSALPTLLPWFVADLNADGNLDLVGADSVALGDGHGGFAMPAPIAFPKTEWYPAIRATADFNGDGLVDLMVSTPEPGVIFLYLARPSGGYDGPFGFPVPNTALAINGPPFVTAVADVNNDGKPDLIRLTQTNMLSILLNTFP